MGIRVRSLLCMALLCVTSATASAAEGALFAAGYWTNFIEHWKVALFKQNAIVVGTLVLGAICIFILTRSKAKK